MPNSSWSLLFDCDHLCKWAISSYMASFTDSVIFIGVFYASKWQYFFCLRLAVCSRWTHRYFVDSAYHKSIDTKYICCAFIFMISAFSFFFFFCFSSARNIALCIRSHCCNAAYLSRWWYTQFGLCPIAALVRIRFDYYWSVILCVVWPQAECDFIRCPQRNHLSPRNECLCNDRCRVWNAQRFWSCVVDWRSHTLIVSAKTETEQHGKRIPKIADAFVLYSFDMLGGMVISFESHSKISNFIVSSRCPCW